MIRTLTHRRWLSVIGAVSIADIRFSEPVTDAVCVPVFVRHGFYALATMPSLPAV